MTADELARLIVARYAAPYGDLITPGTRQQIEICARLAARDIQAAMQVERVAAERARREHIREMAKLPLRQRIKKERMA